MILARVEARVAIALLAVVVVATVASLWSGYSYWVVISAEEGGAAEPSPEPVRGARIQPLRALNFDDGDWSAYILLDAYDYRELDGAVPRNCLKLTDRGELKRIQRELVATYTGGDVATVLSRLVFVRNGKVVFSSGIVLQGRDLSGLQTRTWGFLKPEAASVSQGFAGRFKPVYSPIVIL